MSGAVLVLDDDPLLRRLISATLQDVGGFAVHEAEDGEAGLERVADEQLDAIRKRVG